MNSRGFQLYYDAFVQNALRGREWQITFTTGGTKKGVPRVGALLGSTQPATFAFQTDGEVYDIPFADIVTAAQVSV